jgi:hypothetical protein
MWRCWISPKDNSALTHGSSRSGLRAARVFKGEARVSIRPTVRPPGKHEYRTGQVQEYDLARFAAGSSTWTKSRPIRSAPLGKCKPQLFRGALQILH